MANGHGYYNLAGAFVPTATKEEAVDAWRSERGYSTGGVYDMGGGEIIDTRNVSAPAPTTPGPITPLIQDGIDTLTAPPVDGITEYGWGVGGDFSDMQAPTYLSQLAELGITLPSQQPGSQFGGIQAPKDSRVEPTIPGAARSVDQIKGELYNQVAAQRDLFAHREKSLSAPSGGRIITSGDFDRLSQGLVPDTRPTDEIGDAVFEGMTGHEMSQKITADLQNDWRRVQEIASNLQLRVQRDTLRANLVRSGQYNMLEAKALAEKWYQDKLEENKTKYAAPAIDEEPASDAAFSNAGTMAVDTAGNQSFAPAYHPPGSTPLSGPPKGDSNEEIAARIAGRLVVDALMPLGPISDPFQQHLAAPENLLLFTGENEVNPAMEAIHGNVLSLLYYELMSAGLVNQNGDMLRQANSMEEAKLLELFKNAANAATTEEFFALMGYSPNLAFGGDDATGNVWSKTGHVNENMMDAAETASSILSGQVFSYASQNPSIFSGGGSGGGSARAPASNYWGQASGGLYLWRIGA